MQDKMKPMSRGNPKTVMEANQEPHYDETDGATVAGDTDPGKRGRQRPTKKLIKENARAAKAWIQMQEKEKAAVADSDKTAPPNDGERQRRSPKTKKEQKQQDARDAKALRRKKATLAGLAVSSSDDDDVETGSD